ncbi:MAG: SprB repeat-containing protein [Bacteroidia bacterium]|nr:SprB repeat-containing protein [Bacteroidia bacterium]
MNSTPPLSYNVYYSGWNRTTTNSITGTITGIHHPSADSVQLTGGIGWTDDNYTATCFSMSGVNGPISGGTAPYTGTFIPMGSFSDFNNGQAANGIWQLSVTCTSTGGTLDNWQMTFNYGSGNPTINNLCPGTYHVSITDAGGCAIEDYVTINSGQAILTAVISSFSDVLCNGNCDGSVTVTASAGTPPYSYTWSSGGTDTTETALCAGIYTVTATDQVLNTATATVTIAEPAVLTAIVTTTDVSCFGFTDGSAIASVTGGTTPYLYTWSTGGTNSTCDATTPGTYTLTMSDANLCTDTASATINEPPALTASTAYSDATCFNVCDGTIDLSGCDPGIYFIRYMSPKGNAIIKSVLSE